MITRVPPFEVKEANLVLRELDGVVPGHIPHEGKYQLKWSEDLTSLVPEYLITDGVAQPVMDYVCQCGKNIIVHDPSCKGLTVPRTRFNKVSTFGLGGEFPSYQKVWALCRWVAPPPQWVWEDMMGTDYDYPANGRYVPVSRMSLCVVIPAKTPLNDYRELAVHMVAKIKKWHVTKDEIQAKKDSDQKRLKMPIYDAVGNKVREAEDPQYFNTVDRLKEKLYKFNPDGMVGYTKEIAGKGI